MFTLQMQNAQKRCWLYQRPQGGNPHQWGCPHDQKNLPKDFHQACQTPGLCRSLWSGLAGDRTGYATCNPSQPPVWQQAAGISPLPEFSVLLALFLQLNFRDMHLIPAAPHGDKCLSPAARHGRDALWSCSSLLERVTCVPQLVLGDMLHLGPTGVHSAGATVTRRKDRVGPV